MATKNRDYWAKREENERKWQLKQLKSDDRFNKVLDRSYQVAVDNINKQIEHELLRIGGARNMVTPEQMLEYERLAQEVVAKAQRMREAGKKVTFTSEINERMKVYNATMRINQLELMKSEVGLQLVDLGAKLENSITERVSNAYRDEVKRQAGILGKTTQNGQLWASKTIMQDVTSNVAVGAFSKNIWANIDLMKATLDGLLSTAIIRGDNPREMIKYIKPLVKKSVYDKRYAAERIARTETARVQHEAQVDSLKAANYKYCKWYAEPGACKTCYEISISNSGGNLSEGIYEVDDVPNIPVHPNCRCSIGAYWPDEVKKALSVDKNSDDNNEVTDINSFMSMLDKNYNIKVTNMDDVPVKNLKQIYNGISTTLEKYPQVKNVISEVKGYEAPDSETLASNVFSYKWVKEASPEKSKALANARGQMDKLPRAWAPDAKLFIPEDVLSINKSYLLNTDTEKDIQSMIKEGWMTKKYDYTGVIEHEMGHALMARLGMARSRVTPGVPNTGKAITSWLKGEKSGIIGRQLMDSMSLKGMGYSALDKYVGQYGKSSYSEWFAETYSNKDSNEYTKLFHELLAKEVKKRFK